MDSCRKDCRCFDCREEEKRLVSERHRVFMARENNDKAVQQQIQTLENEVAELKLALDKWLGIVREIEHNCIFERDGNCIGFKYTQAEIEDVPLWDNYLKTKEGGV